MEEEGIEIRQSGSEPTDLLDPTSLGVIVRKNRRKADDSDDDIDDFKRDKFGKIIITEEEKDKSFNQSRKRNKRDFDSENASNDDESSIEEDQKSKVPKRSKKKKRVEQAFGKEFKAKKAEGDAKFKGQKTDPYAYIPLDHRMLNKRKKHQAVKRFQGVGKGMKKGYRPRSGKKS